MAGPVSFHSAAVKLRIAVGVSSLMRTVYVKRLIPKRADYIFSPSYPIDLMLTPHNK